MDRTDVERSARRPQERVPETREESGRGGYRRLNVRLALHGGKLFRRAAAKRLAVAVNLAARRAGRFNGATRRR